MKTFKTTVLSLTFILMASAFANAAEPSSKMKKSMNYAVSQYIECMTKGSLSDLPLLLDDSFKLSVSYGGKTMRYTKKQVVDHMKKLKNTIQNCDTSFSLVEENENFSIAKVEMKYPNFTKINYVTMSAKGDSWTITDVFTTYK